MSKAAAKADGYLVNFSTTMKAYDGRPIVATDEDGKVPPELVKLGTFCLIALGSQLEGDRNEKVEDKVKRGIFAEYVYRAMERKKPVPLTSEEISVLKDRIAKTQAAAVTLACVRLLDPNAAPERALD